MPGDGWRSKEDMFGLKIEPQHVIIRPFLMKLQAAKVCAQWAQTRRPGHFPLRGTRNPCKFNIPNRIIILPGIIGFAGNKMTPQNDDGVVKRTNSINLNVVQQLQPRFFEPNCVGRLQKRRIGSRETNTTKLLNLRNDFSFFTCFSLKSCVGIQTWRVC